MKPISLAIVGLGKIALDQHVPSIRQGSDFDLVGVSSRNARLEGVENHETLDALLQARPDLEAVALCMPPRPRYRLARAAIEAGKHVLMEKPPGATVSEVQSLARLAAAKGVTLFTTWHSRYAAAVAQTRERLRSAEISHVDIQWKEDVRHWHPGQQWVWEPGGLGVFDPGINALSILTEILPDALYLTRSELAFPENRSTPIAAELEFSSDRDYGVRAVFDWLQTGPQTWDITVTTSTGILRLSQGGTLLSIDAVPVEIDPKPEYQALYDRFADLIRTRSSDVDLAPLQHVADAFMLGERTTVAPFHDD